MTERAGVTMPLPSLHRLAPRRCVPVAGPTRTSTLRGCHPVPVSEEEDPRLKKLTATIEKADLEAESKAALDTMLNSQTTTQKWVRMFTANSVNPKHTAMRKEEPLATLPTCREATFVRERCAGKGANRCRRRLFEPHDARRGARGRVRHRASRLDVGVVDVGALVAVRGARTGVGVGDAGCASVSR
jgi:hypothetical protein